MRTVHCAEVFTVPGPESDCVGDDTRQESDLYLICPDPGSCQHTTPTPTLVSHEVWADCKNVYVYTGDNNVATNHSYIIPDIKGFKIILSEEHELQ